MIFRIIDKPKDVFVFFHNKITSIIGTFRNNSLFFFLGIIISKQIAPAALFSFQLRIKTPFRKNITENSIFFHTEVKCKGNTQIIQMEETKKCHRVIRLWNVFQSVSPAVPIILCFYNTVCQLC